MDNLYRRFQLIDKDKEKALNALVLEKGLSHEDLQLILSAIVLINTEHANGVRV